MNDATDPLLNLSIEEVEGALSEIEIRLALEPWNQETGPVEKWGVVVQVYRDRASDETAWECAFYVDHTPFKWTEPWSIEQAMAALEAREWDGEQPPIEVSSLLEEYVSLWIRIPLAERNEAIANQLRVCRWRVQGLFERAGKTLRSGDYATMVTESFHFPPAIRAACEQYLTYFGQFLRDLGIEADTRLREDANRVLFSVSPSEGADALTRIREMLNLYLDLPGSEVFTGAPVLAADPAMQQLHANILHLRSQIVFAAATLEAKDATIEALRLSNLRLTQLSDRPRLAPAAGVAGNEPILGDFVAVRKVEVTGLEVNLPAVLRALKRRFGRPGG